MSLQVLPPELLEQPKDRIETKEPQPYWKPGTLKDGDAEEFRLLGCYETGHAITGWQYASECRDPVHEVHLVVIRVMLEHVWRRRTPTAAHCRFPRRFEWGRCYMGVKS